MKLHLFGYCPDWEIGAQARQRGENTLQMPDRFFVKLPDSFLPCRAMAHIFKSPHLRPFLFPLSFDFDARKDSNRALSDPYLLMSSTVHFEGISLGGPRCSNISVTSAVTMVIQKTVSHIN